jgi:hypothetical protein
MSATLQATSLHNHVIRGIIMRAIPAPVIRPVPDDSTSQNITHTRRRYCRITGRAYCVCQTAIRSTFQHPALKTRELTTTSRGSYQRTVTIAASNVQLWRRSHVIPIENLIRADESLLRLGTEACWPATSVVVRLVPVLISPAAYEMLGLR